MIEGERLFQKMRTQQLLQTMNQKFINLVEKTQKKAPIYDAPKSKRFSRKPSQQSDRSIDSKRSRQTALQPSLKLNNLNIVDPKTAKFQLGGTDFYQQLRTSTMLSKQLQPNKARYAQGRTDRHNIQSRHQSSQSKVNNLEYQNQALSAQLQVRNKQLQVMLSEIQMTKLTIKNEEQKRKKLQQQKKEISNQLSDKIKQLQKIQIQNKKLMKEKEYLAKQIEFLEKINYDDKTRNAQSYRQKYLAKQLQELRKQITTNKSEIQKHLQCEIKRLSDEKYSIQTLYKALKVEKQTLIKQLQRLKIEQRDQRAFEKLEIQNSDEYRQLMKKYTSSLAYCNKLKIEYMELQKELNRSLSNIPKHLLASSSSISIVLSSSSEGSTSKDKQNKGLSRMAKNQLLIETINEKQPMKKSLSPRNREDRNEVDFKKPISPVSNKKSYQISKTVALQGEPKSSAKSTQSQQAQRNSAKKTTFFNDAYRMKIGLSKGATQN